MHAHHTHTHTHTHTPDSVVKHQLHPPHPYSWDSCLGNSNHADIICEGRVCGVLRGVSWPHPPPPMSRIHTRAQAHTDERFGPHLSSTLWLEHRGQFGIMECFSKTSKQFS